MLPRFLSPFSWLPSGNWRVSPVGRVCPGSSLHTWTVEVRRVADPMTSRVTITQYGTTFHTAATMVETATLATTVEMVADITSQLLPNQRLKLASAQTAAVSSSHY